MTRTLIGGIEVENDLLGRTVVAGKELINEHPMETSDRLAGDAKGTNDVLNDYVFGESRSYDKYGVLQEVVTLVQRGEITADDAKALKTNVFALCEELRRAVSASQQAARRETGKQAVNEP